MSTAYRALCEELLVALKSWSPHGGGPLECWEDREEEAALIARAEAELAQPEPVAPTDEEIEEWADASSEVPLEEMDPDIHGWRRCFTAKEFNETIRAALAHWGRQ
jgi:hypothetical protein